MSYCYEAGISHTEFLNWEPNDRAKTIAFALEKGERCISCGTAPWEWQEDPDAYEAVRQQCRGCMKREAVLEDQKDPPKGSSVTMVTKAHAKAIAANPELFVVDSAAKRRARRRAKTVEEE